MVLLSNLNDVRQVIHINAGGKHKNKKKWDPIFHTPKVGKMEKKSQ
jgi:hypothetical protein